MSRLEPLLDLAQVVPPLPEEIRKLVGCYRLELPPALGEIRRGEWTGSGRTIVVGLSTDSYPLAAGMVVKVKPAKGSLRYASWREVDGEARISVGTPMGGYSYRLSRTGEQIQAIAQYWDDAYFPKEWWEVDAEIVRCPPFPKSL